MHSNLRVSEERMEQMRLITVKFLKKSLERDLSKEQKAEYARFHLVILHARLNKLEEVMIEIGKGIQTLMALQREVKRLKGEEERKQLAAEAEKVAAEEERREEAAAQQRAYQESRRRRAEPNLEAGDQVREEPQPQPQPQPQIRSWRSGGGGPTGPGGRRVSMTNQEYQKLKEELELTPPKPSSSQRKF
jgi:hypothetical protein